MVKQTPLYFSFAFAVITHLLLLLWLYFSFDNKIMPSIRPRVVVKTINLQPHVAKAEIIKTDPIFEESPSNENKIKKKIETSKKIKKNQEAQKPKIIKTKPKPKEIKPSPKIQPDKKISSTSPSQVLLSKAKESIAKIQTSSLKDSSTLKESLSFKSLVSLSSLDLKNADLSDEEINYKDELSSRLKLLLKLPEAGNVVIDLTLERSGKVKKVEIIEANSPLNGRYIEKILFTLKLPPFGPSFKGCNEKTFRMELIGNL